MYFNFSFVTCSSEQRLSTVNIVLFQLMTVTWEILLYSIYRIKISGVILKVIYELLLVKGMIGWTFFLLRRQFQPLGLVIFPIHTNAFIVHVQMLHHVGRVAGRPDVLGAQVARHYIVVHPLEVEPHLALLRHSRGVDGKGSKLEDLFFSPSSSPLSLGLVIPSGTRYHA